MLLVVTCLFAAFQEHILTPGIQFIGLDCEWNTKRPVSLLQIATPAVVLLVRICKLGFMLPDNVKLVLEDPTIIKVCVYPASQHCFTQLDVLEGLPSFLLFFFFSFQKKSTKIGGVLKAILQVGVNIENDSTKLLEDCQCAIKSWIRSPSWGPCIVEQVEKLEYDLRFYDQYDPVSNIT